MSNISHDFQTHRSKRDRQLNIVLINTWRLINAKGGTEKVFCDMANALDERGHNVVAICHDKEQGEPGFPLSKRVKLINAYGNKTPFLLTKPLIKLRSLSLSKAKRRERRYALKLQMFGETLSPALQGCPVDCIVSFQAATTHAIKPFISDIPIVTMIHGTPDYWLGACPVFPEGLKESNVIQFLRPEFENIVNRTAPNVKAVCIPNLVPQYEETADRSSHTIINVGRFDPPKKQDLLVNAFGLIKDKFKDWSLEFWGEQFLQPAFSRKVQDMVSRLGMENQVKLCGTTNHIPDELRRASIFAFPSRFEGFPLALTEAMSMGLPAIGWKGCSGVNTMIRDNQNGILCDETPESLAEALERLMRDESLRTKLGNQAKRDMAQYAPEKVWDQWEDLLYSIVDGKSA